ncbi:hypothetical protein GC089_16740 [Cellulomonas sp. JZ18]|uniref:hypothetical protein n=1 Tax=Cellulomonas sp. JZ18 TaxID=2654191 RepID=UPI0012D467F0|nr:hypothetical protein [Cellulomonas sp. JZ18]QGQ20532.1 hypothetical protein GC089_16740 [Cellulomonas sp. JZ18]
MSAQRQRRPRRPGAVRSDLEAWSHLVRRAERREPAVPSGCPLCEGEDGLDARDRLEAVVRRGGRQGRRLGALVRPLDERFEAATVPTWDAPAGRGWWHGRTWDA